MTTVKSDKATKTVTIDGKDNVAVILEGDGSIPNGHKYALRNIKKGDFVIKYGEIIGRASADIQQGEWVHTHNLRSHLDEECSYTYNFSAAEFPVTKDYFFGYKRAWGGVGIRNDIYIIPTVGCVNRICLRLQDISRKYIRGSIDGIFALTHQFGCSQLGEDNVNIKKLLSSIALHPNASYVLFVGLGCENNGIDGIKAEMKDYNRNNVEFLCCQEECDEIERGMSILHSFIEKASELQREKCDFSDLKIGLKCGGSDGYSGLTANPTVGKVTDSVISAGGSAVLTEIPEMFGAEQLLMNRCIDRDTFDRYKSMIVHFKDYYVKMGFPVYENPSPGNKDGGITTLEEKSLGCIKKAGSTAIVDVLSYGERVRKKGLSVLNAPGNDLIAATALAAAGCQMVLFTSGRGTPFSTFVPTLKISTNNVLAKQKSSWIDFNAYGMDDKALYNIVKLCASGEYRCKSEDIREIAFFKTGVTL